MCPEDPPRWPAGSLPRYSGWIQYFGGYPMLWWGWIVLGVAILGAEMFVIDAQFYLVFIGLSAVIVGLTDLLGLALPEWATPPVS